MPEPKFIRCNEGAILNVIGDHQALKLTGENTDGKFVLIEETNSPGTEIPPHAHTHEDEVFRVLEGALEVSVGDQTTVLHPGDLAFAPRNVPHRWRVIGDAPCRTILSIFPAGIEAMFRELSELPAGPPDFEKVVEICGRYGVTFV